MSWRDDRELREGFTAWQRGDLAAALRKLTAVRERRGESAVRLYLVARILHEGGDATGARETLERAKRLDSARSSAAVHAALLDYDLADDARLDEDLLRLPEDHFLGPALLSLRSARQGDRTGLLLPPLAMWNPDILGRLVAVLEAAYLALVALASDDFHHRLFAPEIPHRRSAPPAAADPTVDTGRLQRRRTEWRAAVEEAFSRREFQRVAELWHLEGVPERWRTADMLALKLYSQEAAGAPGAAFADATAALRRQRAAVELHFLHGLSAARAGFLAPAGHAFARAARLSDVEVYAVARGLLERAP